MILLVYCKFESELMPTRITLCCAVGRDCRKSEEKNINYSGNVLRLGEFCVRFRDLLLLLGGNKRELKKRALMEVSEFSMLHTKTKWHGSRESEDQQVEEE